MTRTDIAHPLGTRREHALVTGHGARPPARRARSGDEHTGTAAVELGDAKAIRFNVVARELLRECMKRERRSATPGLRGLAERVGILS